MINVLSRDLNEKTKNIVSSGYIPAIIYGTKLENNIPVKVHKTDFKRLIEANLHTRTIELNLNGDIKHCVIKDIQIDSIKDNYLHIDFKLV